MMVKKARFIISIISCLLIIFSLLFVGIGSYSFFIDNIKSKNYIETTAKIKEYKDCFKNNNKEFCYGVYEYNVNYSTFTTKIISSYEKSLIKDTIIIKYNPTNYNEYIIKINKTNYFYIGLSLLLFTIFIKIISNKVLKK